MSSPVLPIEEKHNWDKRERQKHHEANIQVTETTRSGTVRLQTRLPWRQGYSGLKQPPEVALKLVVMPHAYRFLERGAHQAIRQAPRRRRFTVRWRGRHTRHVSYQTSTREEWRGWKATPAVCHTHQFPLLGHEYRSPPLTRACCSRKKPVFRANEMLWVARRGRQPGTLLLASKCPGHRS